MFVFGPEQLIKSPNRMRWAQSSRKLSIISLTLCPLYSLINGAGAYSITVNACKLVWVVVVFEGSGGLLGFES